MYNDEASKYRVLSHNTAMINYYGCVLIQQIFGYRVSIYSFPDICPAFRKYPGISIEGKNFAAKRIFIKFDRNNNFFYIYTKKNTIKNLKDISLCQIKWMKWKVLRREREKERKIRNETTPTLNQYWEIDRKDILILEKQILSTFFFFTSSIGARFLLQNTGRCKVFSSKRARIMHDEPVHACQSAEQNARPRRWNARRGLR